ncbi:MAG: GDSL-type esterase/lipase family protein [Limisphaerales bacterium]
MKHLVLFAFLSALLPSFATDPAPSPSAPGRPRGRAFAARAAEPTAGRLPAPFPDGARVLFLGDSITFADDYIAYLDLFLRTRHPELRIELINRGMPSETIAGTSEPAHDPPRPDLFTRLEETLAATKPTAVVASYGMNDGLYRPPDDAVFAKYTNGVRRLVARVAQAGLPLTLLTPPPFDPLPFAGRPAAAQPDYRQPSPDYNATLERFAGWLKSQTATNVAVVDVFGFVREQLRLRRLDEPGFTVARDGIHPDATGHLLIALAILRAWQVEPSVGFALVNAGRRVVLGPGTGGAEFLDSSAVRFRWRVPLPLPLDPAWDTNIVNATGFSRSFNRCELRATQLRTPSWDLEVDGARVLSTSAVALFKGLDLAAEPAWPATADAQALLGKLKQLRAAQRELWVRGDPHPRLKGMFADGQATPEDVARLDAELRRLCAPRERVVMLAPVTTE